MPEQAKYHRRTQDAAMTKQKPPPVIKTGEMWDKVRSLIRRRASDDYDGYRQTLVPLCPDHITQDEFSEMCTDYALLRARP